MSSTTDNLRGVPARGFQAASGDQRASSYGLFVQVDSWASSPAVRRNMQANRWRDTGPEMALRRALHSAGLRYRVCARPIPGSRRTVDIVFGPARVAVEVRGCFWHGCPDHRQPAQQNAKFWRDKIAGNIKRDEEKLAALEAAGWLVIVVWEHDDIRDAARHVIEMVEQRRRPRPTPH
jgi:DNA mismatch endonuclease (patch repair protein)